MRLNEKVLMTFQVEPELREAAMKKAKENSINMSAYLRQQVKLFVGDYKKKPLKFPKLK